MKILISRSYSAKIQVKQFEPVESFCAAQMEHDIPDLQDKKKQLDLTAQLMEESSIALDKFCRAEVEKTIEEIQAKNKNPAKQIFPIPEVLRGEGKIFDRRKPKSNGFKPIKVEPKHKDVGKDSAEHDSAHEDD
jgi:hypothetical protein